MKHLFLIILFTAVMTSCESKKAQIIPAHILPAKQMTELLTDVHLTESKINNYQAKGHEVTSFTKLQYDSLFKKYNMTEKQFLENITFYSKHIKLLDDTYTKVLENLSKKQSNPNL